MNKVPRDKRIGGGGQANRTMLDARPFVNVFKKDLGTKALSEGLKAAAEVAERVVEPIIAPVPALICRRRFMKQPYVIPITSRSANQKSGLPTNQPSGW